MRRRLGIAVLVAAITAACGGTVDPSRNQVETKTGTIPMGGVFYLPETINITRSGEIAITVTSLTPSVPSATYFAVGFGQQVSGTCQIISANQFAVVGAAAISGPITPGIYCIGLADAGLFTVNEDFSLTVSHP